MGAGVRRRGALLALVPQRARTCRRCGAAATRAPCTARTRGRAKAGAGSTGVRSGADCGRACATAAARRGLERLVRAASASGCACAAAVHTLRAILPAAAVPTPVPLPTRARVRACAHVCACVLACAYVSAYARVCYVDARMCYVDARVQGSGGRLRRGGVGSCPHGCPMGATWAAWARGCGTGGGPPRSEAPTHACVFAPGGRELVHACGTRHGVPVPMQARAVVRGAGAGVRRRAPLLALGPPPVWPACASTLRHLSQRT